MYTVPLPSLPRNIAPLIFESVFPNTEVEIVSKYATIVSVRPIELCFVSADTDICQCRNADIVSANYRWVISCRYLADIIIGRTLTIVPAALGQNPPLRSLSQSSQRNSLALLAGSGRSSKGSGGCGGADPDSADSTIRTAGEKQSWGGWGGN